MSKTVLIVEDNSLNQKLFHDILVANNYHVVCTNDGNEVMKLIDDTKPELVLMDIQLHGISGIDIIKQIKSSVKYKSIPVIAVTAFTMKDDKEKIMASGCDSYIPKPISIASFMQEVKKYIGEPV